MCFDEVLCQKKIPHQKGLFILWPLAARLNSKRACNIKYICLVCILFWQISIYLEMFVAGPLILGGRGFYSIVFTKVYWLKAAAPKNKGQKQFDKHWNLSKKLPNIEVVNLLWLFESVKIKVSNHVAEMARRKRRTFLEASGEPQRLCRGCHRTSKSSGGFWRPLRLLEAFIKAPPFPPRHSRQMNWHFDFDTFKES